MNSNDDVDTGSRCKSTGGGGGSAVPPTSTPAVTSTDRIPDEYFDTLAGSTPIIEPRVPRDDTFPDPAEAEEVARKIAFDVTAIVIQALEQGDYWRRQLTPDQRRRWRAVQEQLSEAMESVQELLEEPRPSAAPSRK